MTIKLIKQALKEDAAFDDITTKQTVSSKSVIKAELIAKASGVICGLDIAGDVFSAVDADCKLKKHVNDGSNVKPGKVIASVAGPARAVLSAERTALNFVQHLSGIATLTAAFVAKVRGTRSKIYDTRKTTPGLRELEKYAVRCGGGTNHRMNLAEMAMLKDNHVRVASDIKTLMGRIRKAKPGIRIELECESLKEVQSAAECGADVIMLDNMSVKQMKDAVSTIKKMSKGLKRPLIEISGGINLSNVRQAAEIGADIISIGSITHSAPALDISLEVVEII